MAVLSKLTLPIFSDHAVERYCYFYKHANWKGLNSFFSAVDWTFLFCIADIDEYVVIFTNFVIMSAQKFIPYGKERILKTSSPWLNEKCRKLVSDKHAAFGTENYAMVRDLCSTGLYEEYMKHISKTKERLKDCSSDAKKWWRLSKSLLLRQTSIASAPQLQRDYKS